MDIERQIRSLYCKANTIARKFSSCSNHVKNICLKCIVPISIVQVYGQNIMKIHIKD